MFTQDRITHKTDTVKSLVNIKEGGLFMEIGSFEGRSAIEWKKAFNPKEIICIDPLNFNSDSQHGTSEEIYKRFIENTKDIKEIKLKRYNSFDWLIENKPKYREKLDFIYIDGDHRAYNVMEDIILSWNMVKKGGYILFDDYGRRPELSNKYRPQISIDWFLETKSDEIEVLYKKYIVLLQKK